MASPERREFEFAVAHTYAKKNQPQIPVRLDRYPTPRTKTRPWEPRFAAIFAQGRLSTPFAALRSLRMTEWKGHPTIVTHRPDVQASRMRTNAPARRRCASSGTTRKQFARAMAAWSPLPCQGTGATCGSGPAKSQAAGRKRVRPGFAFTSAARAREGEARAEDETACQRAQHRRGEEQESDSGRDGVAGKAEERIAWRAGFWFA